MIELFYKVLSATRKRTKIAKCKTGKYLMSLTNKSLAEKFYGCEIVE